MPRFVTAAVLLCLFAVPAPAVAEDWSDARKEFRAAMKSDDWKEREDAFAVLAYHDSADAVGEALSAMAREENPAVVIAGIRALSGQNSLEAQEAKATALRKSKGATKLYVLMSMEGQTDAKSTALLMEMLNGKDAMAAAQAALVLGRRKSRDAIEPLVKLLKHKDWQIRAAAARALRFIATEEPPKPKEGEEPDPNVKPKRAASFEVQPLLGPLVASLAMSKGRERRDLIETLAFLTDQDFGLDVPAWKAYAGGADPASIRRKPEKLPHAFGIPVYGRRVVFIITNSQRNEDPHRFKDVDRLLALCEVPGARPILHTRLLTVGAFIQAHFKRAINDLPKSTKFDLLAFNTTVNTTFGKFTSANGGTKKTAIETIDGLVHGAGMAHYDAMRDALDLGGAKDSAAWKSGPDEIFFTACNAPNQGELKEPAVVGAAIGLKARLRMVPIHTIGVESHAYEMMAAIANASGGTYLNLYE